MRARYAVPILALCAAATVPPAGEAAAPADPRPALSDILDRAAWYLDFFIDQFENVVAEETYVQDASTLLPIYSPVGGGRGGVALPGPSAGELSRARHRDLRSDFLLVRSPDTLALVPF